MSGRSATPASWSCRNTPRPTRTWFYALVKSFEEAGRLVYSDPAYAKKVARLEFPDLPGDVVDKAIDAEIKYHIPAETVVTKADAWNKLMEMQKFLGNVKGSIPMDQVVDNSFADKAVKEAENVKAPIVKQRCRPRCNQLAHLRQWRRRRRWPCAICGKCLAKMSVGPAK